MESSSSISQKILKIIENKDQSQISILKEELESLLNTSEDELKNKRERINEIVNTLLEIKVTSDDIIVIF